MKKKVETYTALKRRILALVLGGWMLFSVLLTWAVAQDMYNQLDAQLDYLSVAIGHLTKAEDVPGKQEKAMYENLSYPYDFLKFDQLLPIVHPHTPNGVSSSDWLYGKWELYYGFDASVVYFDEEGKPIFPTGTSVFFEYVTQKEWDNSKEEETVGYAFVDMSALEDGEEIYSEWHHSYPHFERVWWFVDVVRMRGYFDGVEFKPIGIALGNYDNPWSMQTIHRNNEFGFSNQDRRGNIKWNNVYSDPTPREEELVTIYCFNAFGNKPKAGVTVNGKKFSSLEELSLEPDSWRYEKKSLWESVLVTQRSCPELEGVSLMETVVRCRPLGYAVARLWRVYLVSLGLAVGVILLLLKNIRRELTQPLEQLSMKLSGLSVMRPDWVEYDSRWQEPYDLERKAVDLQQQLQEAKAETRQLQTALEYAKNAEAYRRRMISGLTHELKTPLAVIHSYAEGLQEGIAQEKTGQYLDVILEESEKMDAMVLQMLDLSRLEAGKVKLSNDRFSLAALTRSVFDRMQPLAAEKGLTVHFTMPNACELTADESRITQVITNLASNAIKYTPEGGTVSVIVYRKGERNVLCVENTCERLSTEALEKVFDSFYRGDAARTTEGTGLGLAIVKAIVEQHGGSCRVFNTPSGVQFQVSLPG